MSSPQFPEPPPKIPASKFQDVDTLVDKLASRKDDWVKVGIPQRIALLDKLQQGVQQIADRWANASCAAMGIDKDAPLAGEQWLAGPMTTARNIHLLRKALEQSGAPQVPGWRTRDGQKIAKVFPANTLDKLMYSGFTAEVWIEKGKDPSQGRVYREGSTEGKVGLVLGAGNVSSIGPMDVLYKMFVENEVCVLKMNPVNEYIGPIVEEAFKALIDDGYFGVVYGGADVGQHLTHHPKVDTIHITGSDRTHDAIIWGATAEEQERNKKNNTPALQKPISSELGCVTPVLVVPGDWSDAEITFQAKHVASMVAQNGSFNCNAAKVIITAKHWALKEKFLAAVERELAAVPVRKAYYPGAQQRYDGFLEHYPQAKPLAERTEEVVPWTIIPDVPADGSEYALNTEAFCGVIAQVEIDAKDADSFLEKAVPFANDEVWGTLSCMVLIHPKTQAQHQAAFETAIADLRYGGIGVNAWAAVLYGLVVTTWGAFPGHPLDDIRSGRGVVHNTYLFDNPEKSVVYAPFMIKPTPAWFAQHKNLKALGKKLVVMEGSPSLLKLPGVLAAALKG